MIVVILPHQKTWKQIEFVCIRPNIPIRFFASAATKNTLTSIIPKKNTNMFEYNSEYNEMQWITNKPIENFSEITKKIIDKLEEDEYFQGIIKLNQIISKQNPNLN